MKTIDERLKEVEIALLQLQRSALIDTQAIMQIMLDKGLCTVEDINETRLRIESESPVVERIDSQILNLGGSVLASPKPDESVDKTDMNEKVKLLKELLSQLPKDTLDN